MKHAFQFSFLWNVRSAFKKIAHIIISFGHELKGLSDDLLLNIFLL